MQIQIPVEDLLRGQLHQPGWYNAKIMVATSKPSKDGQSVNYEYVAKYSERSDGAPVDERDITGRFNSKAMGFMNPFLAAIAGLSIKDFAAEAKKSGDILKFEWEDLKDKTLQIKIENKPRQDNGQLKSEITDYAPIGFKVPF